MGWTVGRRAILLGLCFFVLSHSSVEATPEAPTLVGAARRNITPDMPIRLHGYAARKTEATEVAMPIWARALAIGGSPDSEEPPAVLIAVELLGVPIELTEEVRRRLHAEAGVPADRVAIAATHTHNGPLVRGVADAIFGEPIPEDQQGRIDRYTDRLADLLVAAGLDAIENRRPAHLHWERGEVGFAANRRTQGGPVDRRLPVLAARDADERLIAIVATYACHCTTLGAAENRVHGDWAGVAAAKIETDHPGAVALITIGCGADANPTPRHKAEFAVQYGEALASEVERLLQGPMKPVRLPLSCRTATVELPFDELPTVDEWKRRAEQPGAVGYHARLQLTRLEEGEQLPRVLPYHLASWSFGDDLAMVFLAGEVVVDYAAALGSRFDDDRLWIHAYANDAPCYIPSRRIWNEGGYEGGGAMIYYDQPTRLASTVEKLILDAVQRILPHKYYSETLQRDYPAGKTPEQSLDSMHLPPGLRAELVAAEPLVVDPVAFDWGPDGRLWVVEMRDYPDGPSRPGVERGRLVVLTDEDGDLRYDRSEVFADQLAYPTGVKVWRDGVLVTAAPDILLLKDRDGDSRADVREVLYTGFGEGNQQHRVNGMRWGLDNWLHVANGDSNGTIRSLATGAEIRIGGRDLRIQPDLGLLEAESGPTQFGREKNNWGDWFGNNNVNPLWHYVLPERYLRRNPYLAAPSPRHDVSETPGAARVYPASRTLTRFNDWNFANRFTSACGPTIYRDDWLGPAYAGNAFACEPVHNLLHREQVVRDGLTYRSRRADSEQTSEFLASEDHWFRPVMARTGPDGALWIADMYRYVIEHPEWIPEDFQRRMDVAAGNDQGRIYRIVRTDAAPRSIPRLDTMSTAELVNALASPNGWQRDMAQQLLVWRADNAAQAPLAEMAQNHPEPLARLHALATLSGLGSLAPEVAAAALRDKHPGVRRLALRVAEPLFETHVEKHAEVLQAMIDLLPDNDPSVQLQLGFSLGASDRPEAARGLADYLARRGADVRLAAAGLSSLRADTAAIVFNSLGESKRFEQLPTSLVRRLVRHGLRLAPSEIRPLAKHLLSEAPSPLPLATRLAVAAELADQDRDSGELEAGIQQLIDPAGQLVLDRNAALPDRLLALELLSRVDDSATNRYGELGSLLTPEEPTALQIAAVRGLDRQADDRQVTEVLLARWGSSGPALHREIFAALASRPERLRILLEHLEEGRLPEQLLSTQHRQALLRHRDPSIGERAVAVLGQSNNARSEVIAAYGPALTLAGSEADGRRLFEKHCSVCHQLGDLGTPIGPDLAALTNTSPQALLTALLDPNRAVEEKYLNYLALTTDGRQVSGMIVAETANHVTLAADAQRRHVLLRTEIEALQATGLSLMPEGFEKDLAEQDVADLIAFLRSHRAPPKSFAGNAPRLIDAGDESTIALPASAGSIYGPRLVFEHKYDNLGWWIHPDDWASWDVKINQPGIYQVSLQYACPASDAGNDFVVSIAGRRLEASTRGSDSWDRYIWDTVGEVELSRAVTEVTVRSAGPPRGALFDLREVRLERLD